MMKRFLFILFYILLCISLSWMVAFAQSDAKANLSKSLLLSPENLRVEYKGNPFTDQAYPRFSWELSSALRGQYQRAFRIVISLTRSGLGKESDLIWDSGKVLSGETNQISFSRLKLKPLQRYYWKVMSWDKKGLKGIWSEVSYFETGFMGKEWSARWIGLARTAGLGNYDVAPVTYLSRRAEVSKKVIKARLYVSSLGLNEFYINGQKVGKDYFAPGWTDYNKRVYYNAYDVSAFIRKGENNFCGLVSPGWYAGYIGYGVFIGSDKKYRYYGETPALKAKLVLYYADGTVDEINTDKSWRASLDGAITSSDILQGESYDARKAATGEDKSGAPKIFDLFAQELEEGNAALELYPGNPVRIIKEISPKRITRFGGKYIFDFGQNFAGVVRLNIKGSSGEKIVLRYGEMLNSDGGVMRDNLRAALCTDSYILKGQAEGEQFQPRFSYHGFQFVEVSGLAAAPGLDLLTGIVMSSDTETSGTLQTDNKLINKLYSNILWTQRSNYFDIPTDCPQRDERLGWTADAHSYMRSASFNSDISAFHTKWIQDLNDAQLSNGAYPIYAPMPVDGNGFSAIRSSDSSSPGWSEAGVICPYNLFLVYNDKRIIEHNWKAMKRFMDYLYVKSKGRYYFAEGSFEDIVPKGGFGDWLSVGKKTPPDLLASLYYGYCAKLMAEMARAVGRREDERTYRQVQSEVAKAFLAHYGNRDGKLKANALAYGDAKGYVEGELGFDGDSQTAYANAIYMDLFSEQEKKLFGLRLKELVLSNQSKPTTGFLGFKSLLPALSITGNSDLAYQLILDTRYPSLGFEVVNGASTIWERWDSYTKESGIGSPMMNSFNQYAFGAVCEWMYEHMAGIKAASPGYRTFSIRPEIAPFGISKVSASFHSINGWIKSGWEKKTGKILQSVSIPVNTTARVFIACSSKPQVKLDGRPISASSVCKIMGYKNGYLEVELSSGVYCFESEK